MQQDRIESSAVILRPYIVNIKLPNKQLTGNEVVVPGGAGPRETWVEKPVIKVFWRGTRVKNGRRSTVCDAGVLFTHPGNASFHAGQVAKKKQCFIIIDECADLK